MKRPGNAELKHQLRLISPHHSMLIVKKKTFYRRYPSNAGRDARTSAFGVCFISLFFVLSSSLSGRQDEGVEMGTESNVISIVRIRGEINI